MNKGQHLSDWFHVRMNATPLAQTKGIIHPSSDSGHSAPERDILRWTPSPRTDGRRRVQNPAECLESDGNALHLTPGKARVEPVRIDTGLCDTRGCGCA